MEEQKKTEEMRKEYEMKIQDLQIQLQEKNTETTDLDMKTNSNDFIKEFGVCKIRFLS